MVVNMARSYFKFKNVIVTLSVSKEILRGESAQFNNRFHIQNAGQDKRHEKSKRRVDSNFRGHVVFESIRRC